MENEIESLQQQLKLKQRQIDELVTASLFSLGYMIGSSWNTGRAERGPDDGQRSLARALKNAGVENKYVDSILNSGEAPHVN